MPPSKKIKAPGMKENMEIIFVDMKPRVTDGKFKGRPNPRKRK